MKAYLDGTTFRLRLFNASLVAPAASVMQIVNVLRTDPSKVFLTFDKDQLANIHQLLRENANLNLSQQLQCIHNPVPQYLSQ